MNGTLTETEPFMNAFPLNVISTTNCAPSTSNPVVATVTVKIALPPPIAFTAFLSNVRVVVPTSIDTLPLAVLEAVKSAVKSLAVPGVNSSWNTFVPSVSV